jgi:uncharacterized membrane protein YfcA
MLEPLTILVAAVAVFAIAFLKGAFGGGFAILGIPLLALVMDPISGGALLAPLFLVMDVFAFRYWRPSTWSWPDLILLVPGLLLGSGLGFIAMQHADRHVVAVAIAVITLGFAALWFAQGSQVVVRPRSRVKGALAGVASGVTSMIAHSGGPPVAMYLLPLGLPKALYAGTTATFFCVANLAKVGPWLLLARPGAALWGLTGLCALVVPAGVWVGWRFHERIDQHQLYGILYGLLVVVGLKLLWDGLRGMGLLSGWAA